MEFLEKVHLVKFAYQFFPYFEFINPYLLVKNLKSLRKINKSDSIAVPPLTLVYKVSSSANIE